MTVLSPSRDWMEYQLQPAASVLLLLTMKCWLRSFDAHGTSFNAVRFLDVLMGTRVRHWPSRVRSCRGCEPTPVFGSAHTTDRRLRTIDHARRTKSPKMHTMHTARKTWLAIRDDDGICPRKALEKRKCVRGCLRITQYSLMRRNTTGKGSVAPKTRHLHPHSWHYHRQLLLLLLLLRLCHTCPPL